MRVVEAIDILTSEKSTTNMDQYTLVEKLLSEELSVEEVAEIIMTDYYDDDDEDGLGLDVGDYLIMFDLLPFEIYERLVPLLTRFDEYDGVYDPLAENIQYMTVERAEVMIRLIMRVLDVTMVDLVILMFSDNYGWGVIDHLNDTVRMMLRQLNADEVKMVVDSIRERAPVLADEISREFLN